MISLSPATCYIASKSACNDKVTLRFFCFENDIFSSRLYVGLFGKSCSYLGLFALICLLLVHLFANANGRNAFKFKILFKVNVSESSRTIEVYK